MYKIDVFLSKFLISEVVESGSRSLQLDNQCHMDYRLFIVQDSWNRFGRARDEKDRESDYQCDGQNRCG